MNNMKDKAEQMMMCCVWSEVPNGKGNIYKTSCLRNSSNGVNIFKVAKKYRMSILDIFRKCPYCGHNVVINSIERKEDGRAAE